MAVTNRGSILISTANDIGSSLVDVIGGEGYTPNEWSKKINLCGIAAADVPTALENIEESTPSGTDRGSISLDTANAVGAVLNKKFNTARGFKPSEWASAISKLTELEVKTASGSVASFDDGADDVPLKSCTCEIVPQQDLHGYANPWAPGAGKNKIFPNDCNFDIGTLNFKVTNGTLVINGRTDGNGISSKNVAFKNNLTVTLGAGTYYFSRGSITRATYVYDTADDSTALVTNSGSFTLSATTTIYVGFYYGANIEQNNFVVDCYLVAGSSSTTYEPYSNICPITGTTEIEVTHTDGQNPPIESETKTAALGRTVYGGSFSSDGTLTETHKIFTLTGSSTENYSGSGNRIVLTSLNSQTAPNIDNVSIIAGNVCSHFPQVTNNNTYGGNLGFSVSASEQYTYLYFSDGSGNMTAEGFKTWLQNNPITLVLKVKTPTTYVLDPLPEINSYYGDNNIFSDVQGGNTTVEYRADIDLAAT